jgi:hypothetical protein
VEARKAVLRVTIMNIEQRWEIIFTKGQLYLYLNRVWIRLFQSDCRLASPTRKMLYFKQKQPSIIHNVSSYLRYIDDKKKKKKKKKRHE